MDEAKAQAARDAGEAQAALRLVREAVTSEAAEEQAKAQTAPPADEAAPPSPAPPAGAKDVLIDMDL